VNAFRLALALFAIGCGGRPLSPGAGCAGDGGGGWGGARAAGGAGAGAGASVGAVGAGGAGGAGGQDGAAGAGGGSGAPKTGCAWVQTSDCAGAETGTLSDLQIVDRGADGMVSAGEAATVSVTLTAGDQSFDYPSIGLTDDNPLVTISPSLPQATVYALSPHTQLGGTFDFLVDPSVPPGTVVHFTACPAILTRFCGNGARLAFDVVVRAPMTPAWTIASGPPAQFPGCGAAAADTSGVCAGVGQIALSNPRAVFFRNGNALFVSPSAWATNSGSRPQTICARAAGANQSSYVTQQSVDPGKSADVALTTLNLGTALPTGAPVHFTVWTGSPQANCPDAPRIEFDAVTP